jgi:hypothetical protein
LHVRSSLIPLSKAAEALSTTPAKGAAFAGSYLLSKAAEALSTTPAKGAAFAGSYLLSKAAEALATTPAKGAAFAGSCPLSKAAEALATMPAKGAPSCWLSRAAGSTLAAMLADGLLAGRPFGIVENASRPRPGS